MGGYGMRRVALLVGFAVILVMASGVLYYTSLPRGMAEPVVRFNATGLDNLDGKVTLTYESRVYSGRKLELNTTTVFTVTREKGRTVMVGEFRTDWWLPSHSSFNGTDRAEVIGSRAVIYQPDGSIFVEGEKAGVELFRVGYPYSPVFERLKPEKGYTLKLCCANLTVEDVGGINGRDCLMVRAETEDAVLKLVIDSKTRLLLWEYGVLKDGESHRWEEWLVSSN
ncbi:hypothetical protein [Thermococcus sp. 21S7]|uniref:hypothetical protein n=1 Tax=Thermococcus sp. 21S7 TaxID=1638221 RepID=UPI00143A6B61|nr:hypothetical protein [Thermococcus sp. 21S7]NJE61668.1 hypothetical protein [Thermococcus sp. 21S7]